MKILQVHNIVSHHQIPFATELMRLVGKENFLYAALGRPDLERVENGWTNKYTEEWIIHPNESANELEKYENFWQNADLVICGERLVDRIQDRLNRGKLCFYISERWWKPPIGVFRLLNPKFFNMALAFKKLAKNQYFYYLPTGPFAAKDMRLLAGAKTSMWRWGYLTELPKSKKIKNSQSSSDPLSILWLGRMVKLKRVDLLIETLASLQNEGRYFKLTLVGNGPERKKLEKLASKLLYENSYVFNDFIPSTEVLAFMSNFDIYVLPSNAYEGWGSVVNEAMSVGCAVIASDKTGAGATLIDSGVNGLLFKSGSKKSLYNALNEFFTNPEMVDKFGTAGQRTIETEWNPESAAIKLFAFAQTLLNNKEFTSLTTGLLSKLE